MKKQPAITIIEKSTLQSWTYSSLSGIIQDFPYLGRSKSWLYKQSFPIDLPKYRINSGEYRKIKYKKTNYEKLNS